MMRPGPPLPGKLRLNVNFVEDILLRVVCGRASLQLDYLDLRGMP